LVKKILKWLGFVIAGVVVVALLGFAWLYFASEHALSQRFTAADNTELVIPTDSAEIAEGRRIALLAGCLHCHGDNLAGTVVDDIPNFVRLVAPNISTLLPNYSDRQLAIVLRKGVKPDGSSVLFMPSEMFRHLRDEDLARLIAWLRTVPPTAEGIQERTALRPIARLLLAKGDFKPSASAIESLPPPVPGFDATDPLSHGRYLAMNLCSECHAQDLQGFAPINAPPLTVAKGYSAGQFARLMKEGVAAVERHMPLMAPVSKARFVHLRDDEVSDLYAFLQSR
jgi:cytochrome c553